MISLHESEYGFQTPVKEFQKQDKIFRNSESRNPGSWRLLVAYPEEVKIITQSKDIDVHSLIGNIGGYLGLFLGEIIILIE